MTDTVVRVGNADDARPTPLSFYARHLPIIVVPGIMGTRLSTKQGKIVWNPTLPGMPRADAKRLADLTELEPGVSNAGAFTEPSKKEKRSEIVNYDHLVPLFYEKLCFAMRFDLAKRFEIAGINRVPRVYAAGYDWRQSNTRSMQRLASVVDRALDECDGEQAIIVAHSMGGLVSRYYCKNGGAKNVRALFLLGSPTLGAPKGYVYLKDGMPIADLSDAYVRLVLLKMSKASSRRLLRKMPSIYELAPNTGYGGKDPQWLSFDPAHTGYPEVVGHPARIPDPDLQFQNCDVDQDKLYSDPYTGFVENKVERSANTPSVSIASAFHVTLTETNGLPYMPEHTYALYGSSVSTCVGARVPYFAMEEDDQGHISVLCGPVSTQHAKKGDGTVPVVSALPLKTSNSFDGNLDLGAVQHGTMASDTAVTSFLLDTIPTIV